MQRLCFRRHTWGCRLLRRLRTYFILGALIDCLVLFVGLFHDFSLTDPSKGWFTTNPAVPVALLVIGYLLMMAQRFASRGEE